jgi:RNA polymerase sigma factor for flagellar operon FliA
MDAVAAYDPGQSTRFSTFCSKRVFGAIIDHLRDLDPTPRLVREREAMLARTRDEFRKQFGRMPAESEIVERLGMGESDGQRVLKDGVVVRTTSLGPKGGASESERGPSLSEFVSERGQAADEPAIRGDLRRFIVRHFDRSERLAVILYYYEQLTMREIGKVLGCSESRVSQIIDGILKRLRVYLNGREDELV